MTRTRVKPRAEIPLHATRQRNEPTIRSRIPWRSSSRQSVSQPFSLTLTRLEAEGGKGREREREREVANLGKNAFPRDFVFHAWIIDVSPRFLSVDRNEENTFSRIEKKNTGAGEEERFSKKQRISLENGQVFRRKVSEGGFLESWQS